MNNLLLAFRQIMYETKAFRRNPPAAVFTFIFPLIFLVMLNLLFGNNTVDVTGGTTHASTFYVPAITAFSVISACYTNLAMTITFSRDRGHLKRIKGTPLPSWVFFFGRIGNSILISMILVVIVVLSGALFYNVPIPINTLPALLITLIIGAATFSSLGIAITTIIPNADAAPAIVNALILPLLFISDIFIPMHDAPKWLNIFTNIFPVKPFSSALQSAFNPFQTNSGFELINIGIMTIWLLLGLFIAVRYFSWEPKD